MNITFRFIKQNMAFALSLFSDGSMVTRGRDMSFKGNESARYWYDRFMKNSLKEIPHASFGAGLRFIMNENFIVAFEYGMPVTHLLKASNPYKDQDGTGAFYINIGYLF